MAECSLMLTAGEMTDNGQRQNETNSTKLQINEQQYNADS